MSQHPVMLKYFRPTGQALTSMNLYFDIETIPAEESLKDTIVRLGSKKEKLREALRSHAGRNCNDVEY